MRTSRARAASVAVAWSSPPAHSSVRVSIRASLLRAMYTNTPLALKPKSAIEIARNAKW